jgi:hypothetical protein
VLDTHIACNVATGVGQIGNNPKLVAYRVYSELAGPGFEERLKRIEGDAKKSLPMKLDDVTTWWT